MLCEKLRGLCLDELSVSMVNVFRMFAFRTVVMKSFLLFMAMLFRHDSVWGHDKEISFGLQDGSLGVPRHMVRGEKHDVPLAAARVPDLYAGRQLSRNTVESWV